MTPITAVIKFDNRQFIAHHCGGQVDRWIAFSSMPTVYISSLPHSDKNKGNISMQSV